MTTTMIMATTIITTTTIDHDHDHHHHHDHPHDWHSDATSTDWIDRDARRMAERKPILEALIAAVPFPRDAQIDVLDVGGGAGVVTEAVLDAFPAARVTVQDFSEQMLARARSGSRATTARSATCNATCTIRRGRRRSAGRSTSWCPASPSTI